MDIPLIHEAPPLLTSVLLHLCQDRVNETLDVLDGVGEMRDKGLVHHTLLKFSGRRQPGCFWATFRTPTHFLFHQKHHFHATIYPENDVEASGRCLELKKRCLGSRRRQPGCYDSWKK